MCVCVCVGVRACGRMYACVSSNTKRERVWPFRGRLLVQSQVSAQRKKYGDRSYSRTSAEETIAFLLASEKSKLVRIVRTYWCVPMACGPADLNICVSRNRRELHSCVRIHLFCIDCVRYVARARSSSVFCLKQTLLG